MAQETKLTIQGSQITGTTERQLSGITITASKSLLEFIQDDCLRTIYFDVVDALTLYRPTSLQEVEDLLRENWNDRWISDGLIFQTDGYGSIVIGEEATDNSGKGEGWIYNEMMKITVGE